MRESSECPECLLCNGYHSPVCSYRPPFKLERLPCEICGQLEAVQCRSCRGHGTAERLVYDAASDEMDAAGFATCKNCNGHGNLYRKPPEEK